MVVACNGAIIVLYTAVAFWGSGAEDVPGQPRVASTPHKAAEALEESVGIPTPAQLESTSPTTIPRCCCSIDPVSQQVALKFAAVTFLAYDHLVSSPGRSASSTVASADAIFFTLSSRTAAPTALAASTSAAALITEVKGWSMLLCPEQTHTSPNTTSASLACSPLLDVADTEKDPASVGGCAGRTTFQMPLSFTVAVSVARLLGSALLSASTVTLTVSPAVPNPHTEAPLPPCCNTIWSPYAVP
mmetsp:Transcript_22814/g.59508  ORF Transcript_22814/g.59508 Transcript_22814/m.59508 type:complete len:245 (-) Transcript_22814:176-910(-)